MELHSGRMAMLLIVFSLPSLVLAQKQEVSGIFPMDSLVFQVLDANDLEILSDIDFDIGVALKDIEISNELFQSINELKSKLTPKNDKKMPIQISNNNTFYKGGVDTSVVFPFGVVYSNLEISSNINLLGVRSKFGGSIVLINGNIEPQFSKISLTYAAASELEKLKSKYISALSPEDCKLSSLEDKIGFEQIQIDHFKQDLTTELYQKIISSSEFQNTKRTISLELHKIKGITDSTYNDELCQLRYSLEDKLEKLENLEKRYQEFWNKKEVYSSSVKDLKNEIDDYSKKLESLKDYDNTKKVLLKNVSSISLVDKIKIWTKDFSIGSFYTNNTDFTYRNLSLNGVNYAFEGNKFYSETGFGFEDISDAFSLSYNPNFKQFGNKRSFFYINFGLRESNGDNIQITYL
ncbi:MAG: hypothetical protein R2784_14670, partial [Saprospiraceae bacterium]